MNMIRSILGNQSVIIVGVDDGGWDGKSTGCAVNELKDDSFIIYLVHEPSYRGDGDANLTLAGHTHGGQIIPSGSERIISGGWSR